MVELKYEYYIIIVIIAEHDFYDVIGIMNTELNKMFLKIKIEFHLYYDEDQSVRILYYLL